VDGKRKGRQWAGEREEEEEEEGRGGEENPVIRCKY